jgi:putative FmdB family regulatory protein
MPTYSFRCLKCGKGSDVFLRMSEVKAPRCCRRAMVREYRPAQVVRDGYRAPRFLACLNSLDGDDAKDAPPFETRCEERKYRAAHQEKFGWGAE